MQKRVVLLLVLLLVSLNLFTAGEEKVAVLVDELLYSEPDFQDSLNTFITSAQQCFPEVLISNIQHDVYQGIDPVGDMQSVNIRKIIYDLWQSENIVGVILVGDVPLPVFQSFEIPWDNPIYYPVALAYEDLDGSFYNDNSVGPDGLRVDGPGDDLFIDTWEPVSENNRPDIWVSVIRPRELLYNTGSLNNSFEAEDAVINGNAAIFNDSFCSGGQGVLGVGQGPLNDLVFNDIVVPADGVYQCTVYYVSTYREWPGMVSVNGKAGIILPFKFVSDSAAVSQNFPVYLTASQANSIRFFMDRADSPLPIIDKIEITVVNGYEQELVQDMIKYLEKCTSYFNGQLVIPQRGMIYSADTYAIYPPNPGEIGTISADMRDIYGEENLTVEGFNYATGQEYLNLLSNGYKLNHLRTHSGPW